MVTGVTGVRDTGVTWVVGIRVAGVTEVIWARVTVLTWIKYSGVSKYALFICWPSNEPVLVKPAQQVL